MKTASSIYSKLATERESYVQRAVAAASLTVPSLFPPEGAEGRILPTPYQGEGSRGLKSLSSKIVMTQLPPNEPFCRLYVSAADLEGISQGQIGKVEEGLAQVERLIIEDTEQRKYRTALEGIVPQLLLAGNVLLYYGKDGARFYRLDKYVTKRDAVGTPLLTVLKESIHTDRLPEQFRASLRLDPTEEQHGKVDLYTVIRKEKGRYVVHQEVKDRVVPGTRIKYRAEECPWLPLRLFGNEGESYARSYVEEHMGDLHGLENLYKAIIEGTLAASRLIIMCKPGGTTKPKTIQDARNGDVVTGSMDEVGVLQLDRFADFGVAKALAADIRQGLAQSFLMNTSVQRQAERVTAEEIRTMTAELESVLGGVYGLLSAELQLPLVRIILGRLSAEGKIPAILKTVVKPRILTGIEALGRGQDAQRLGTFLSVANNTLTPEVVKEALVPEEVMSRLAVAYGVDPKGLIRSRQEISDNKRRAQEAVMAEKMAPAMAKQQLEQGGN